MTAPHHYKSNLRDIYFNLFEVLDIGHASLGRGPFSAMDEASARDAIAAFEKLASTDLAASFEEGDRVPLHIDDAGHVILPEGLKRSMRTFHDNDWHRLELPEHLGGLGAPPTVVWGAFELLVGSNPAAAFYLFGTFIARIIDRLGTDAQKRRFVSGIIDRRWGGTMVLTEPDAGSDVGNARTRARPIEGGLWEIDGVKRFITNGDFDYAENIVHLVLARPEGAGPGTKGLSLFIVPKLWVEEDGRLGEPNGVRCTKLEKKMGLKASATCELTFGDGPPARGFLMGNVHDGIRQMFAVIEQARMAVGMKSMATLSTAYLNALAYTKERVQGSDLLRATDKAAPRVPIIRHPDVRRMLMMQKAHVEGMRALALFTASIQDQVEIHGGHSDERAAEYDRLNDLLLPLVKGYSSEKCYELLSLSLQCFGGSGYCQDYPIEQYLRDQKIDSLYEGTTHIQALDLFFRKIGRDQGKTLRSLLGRVQASLDENLGGDLLAPERRALQSAVGDMEGILMAMMGKLGESLYHAGLQGNRILFALAETLIGWLLLRQAAVAAAKRETASESERAFYDGKLAGARFFAANVLPGIGHTRKLIEAGTLDLMHLSDEAF